MYCADEPSAIFHGLQQAHRKRVMEQQSARGVAELGNPMLLLVLLHGEEKGKVFSQREVARTMRLSPATVAMSLRSLERQGYVARRADEHDQRRNRVVLTEKGRQAVGTCGQAFRAVDEQMLSGFSRQERAQLTSFLLRMLENLGGPPEFLPPPLQAKEES